MKRRSAREDWVIAFQEVDDVTCHAHRNAQSLTMTKQHTLPWTASEIALLHKLYPHVNTREVCRQIGRPFHATRQKARQLDIRKTPAYFASASSGRFRLGQKTSKERNPNPPFAVGAEVIRKNCLLRKVSSTGDRWVDWRFVHHIVWEQAHGPIPKGRCIIFRDGNKMNPVLANLALVTQAERNRIAGAIYQSYPKELRQAIRGLSRLKKKITEQR